MKTPDNKHAAKQDAAKKETPQTTNTSPALTLHQMANYAISTRWRVEPIRAAAEPFVETERAEI